MAYYHVCFIDGFSSRAVQLLYDDTDVYINDSIIHN